MAPRVDSALGNGLRTKRVTNKTRLKVVDGDVADAELVLLEEDSDKNKVLDTAGVEHEDAKEEHLVKVLAEAARRIGASRATKSSEDANASIPIPDATGIAANWEESYPSNKFTDPVGYIKFSDTVEESVSGTLNGGYTYDMDERDVQWLDKNNSIAQGEGSSTAPPPSSGGSSRKGRKESTERPTFVISDNEFEFVMALFEKFTDDKAPYLHLDVVKGLPPLSEYEPLFANPLPGSTWATFVIPSPPPDPAHLVRLARTIYPHWKERKIMRQGRRIIPTLNLDEANEGDPYICFRRRDAKSVRKTRRTDTTPSDKIIRLRTELAGARDMAHIVLNRELKKLELGKDSRTVLDARVKFVEVKRKFPQLGVPADEGLLIDPERMFSKRPRHGDSSVSLKINRRSKDAGDIVSPYTSGHLDEAPNPHERAASNQREIDRHCETKKNSSWEDYLDLPVNLPAGIPPNAAFHTVLPAPKRPTNSAPRTLQSRQATFASVRLRRGRGGRVYYDRRPLNDARDPSGPPSPIPAPPAPPPPSTLGPPGYLGRVERYWSVSSSSTIAASDAEIQEDSETAKNERQEYERMVSERWRYDDDSVMADTEQRVVIDEFDIRYLRRRNAFTEAELAELSVDMTHISHAEYYTILKQKPFQEALRHARALEQRRKEEQAMRAQVIQAQAAANPSAPVPPAQTPQPPQHPAPPQPAVNTPSPHPTAAHPAPPPTNAQPYSAPLHVQQVPAAMRVASPAAGASPRPGMMPPQPPQTSAPMLPPNARLQYPTQPPSTQSYVPPGYSNGSAPSQAPLDTNGASTPTPRPKSQPQAPMMIPQVGGFHNAVPFGVYPPGAGPLPSVPQSTYLPASGSATSALTAQQSQAYRDQMMKHAATQPYGAGAGLGRPLAPGMMPPPQLGGPPNGGMSFHHPPPSMNPTPPLNLSQTNMSLKMPPTRQMQWARHNGVDPAGQLSQANGSPASHHPTAGSPARLPSVNGVPPRPPSSNGQPIDVHQH